MKKTQKDFRYIQGDNIVSLAIGITMLFLGFYSQLVRDGIRSLHLVYIFTVSSKLEKY